MVARQGHIEWFQDKDHRRYVVPKVPELLAAAAIEFLDNEARKKEFPEQLKFILEQSERLPFSDFVEEQEYIPNEVAILAAFLCYRYKFLFRAKDKNLYRLPE
ncbi:hypothetical protein AMS62_26470 [Bacillus sp. FJAT-18019]|nr:hypothetical protein AMS62_26470 [Bacillus sp. FJAT-18019]